MAGPGGGRRGRTLSIDVPTPTQTPGTDASAVHVVGATISPTPAPVIDSETSPAIVADHTLELGHNPTTMQLMEKTKKLKLTGEWGNEKTRQIVEKFDDRKKEAHARAMEEGASSEGHHSPPPDDDTIFMEVVGGKNKKGHVYGLGQLGDYYMGSSSEMSTHDPVEVQQLKEVITNLRVQMESKDKNISELQSNLEATQTRMQQQDKHIEEQNERIDNIQPLFKSMISLQAPQSSQQLATPLQPPLRHDTPHP